MCAHFVCFHLFLKMFHYLSWLYLSPRLIFRFRQPYRSLLHLRLLSRKAIRTERSLTQISTYFSKVSLVTYSLNLVKVLLICRFDELFPSVSLDSARKWRRHIHIQTNVLYRVTNLILIIIVSCSNTMRLQNRWQNLVVFLLRCCL